MTSPDPQAEAVAFLAGLAQERLSTHISHIFLAGGTAWKLKRAVRFSFLDYSTLALRKHYCEREVALNSRTAPGLYRGVRALTRAPAGGLEWDGPGAPVDYVVEMARFPQEAVLDQAPLTPALMRDLADEIAAFHAGAEIIPGPSRFAAILRDNEENLRAYGLHVDGLAAAHARVAPLLEARAAGGHVRRCHGDLHLRNILCLDGKPVLFDAIEFSEDFACIDVLYDLAFLLMDLLHRGEAEHAAAVMNRYLGRTSETDGLAALPLFIATRAAIRALVARVQGQSGADYLALAERALTPGAPRLIAIGGLSGSGKSTLAAALSPRFGPVPGALVLRTDVIRKRLHNVAPETRLPESAYTREKSAEVYTELHNQARAALASGYTVILDAAFLRAAERRAAEALAAARNVPFSGFFMDAPVDILTARLEARRNDASDAGVDTLHNQFAHLEPEQKWPRLDAARPFLEQCEAVYGSIEPVSIKR
jgi:aminoglycoside phosphotransferase family enzyme/predicted kinase